MMGYRLAMFWGRIGTKTLPIVMDGMNSNMGCDERLSANRKRAKERGWTNTYAKEMDKWGKERKQGPRDREQEKKKGGGESEKIREYEK